MFPGGGNCLEPGAVPMPPRARLLLPGTGLPISPGAILPLGPDDTLLLSGSNLTKVPCVPSFFMTKEPPPFWGLPSVSQISNSSLRVIVGSLGGLNCSTCRRTWFTLWNTELLFAGLVAVKCLHAWLTKRRVATGRDV